jgi:hypothetical protein
MVVRVHYNHLFYRDVEIKGINIVNEKVFENFKQALSEIKTKKNHKVLVFDSLGNDTQKSDFKGGNVI